MTGFEPQSPSYRTKRPLTLHKAKGLEPCPRSLFTGSCLQLIDLFSKEISVLYNTTVSELTKWSFHPNIGSHPCFRKDRNGLKRVCKYKLQHLTQPLNGIKVTPRFISIQLHSSVKQFFFVLFFLLRRRPGVWGALVLHAAARRRDHGAGGQRGPLRRGAQGDTQLLQRPVGGAQRHAHVYAERPRHAGQVGVVYGYVGPRRLRRRLESESELRALVVVVVSEHTTKFEVLLLLGVLIVKRMLKYNEMKK